MYITLALNRRDEGHISTTIILRDLLKQHFYLRNVPIALCYSLGIVRKEFKFDYNYINIYIYNKLIKTF